MVEGHILKFLKRQTSTQTSKRVFPEQKNGHSKQSPEWFKRKFSLQAQGGYEYRNDQPKIKQKFMYTSQKNRFDVTKQHNRKKTQEKDDTNGVHNLKKGLLSEYLDKNSWMKDTVPLTGFQRDQTSRRLNNRDRQRNIETVRQKKSTYIASKTASNFYLTSDSKKNWKESAKDQKIVYQKDMFQNRNPENLVIVGGKSFVDRSKSIPTLIGQKQQIRSERNQLAMNKIYKIEKFKLDQTLITKSFRTIDSQFVQQRMAMTAREWGGKKSSPHKSIERINQIIGSRGREHHKGSIIKRLSVPLPIDDFSQNFQENKFLSTQL